MRDTKKRAALYTRVSTDKQTADNQLLELRRLAEVRGWEVTPGREYCDAAITGKRATRPALSRMMKAVHRGEVDIVVAWSVDRLGRTLRNAVALCDDLLERGVDLVLHQQPLDTTTSAGRAMFQMVAVFAEFEAAQISERTHAGLRRARAEGKRLGRPPLPAHKVAKVRAALAGRASVRAAAAAASVSVGAAQKIKREMAKSTPPASKSPAGRADGSGVHPSSGAAG